MWPMVARAENSQRCGHTRADKAELLDTFYPGNRLLRCRCNGAGTAYSSILVRLLFAGIGGCLVASFSTAGGRKNPSKDQFSIQILIYGAPNQYHAVQLLRKVPRGSEEV